MQDHALTPVHQLVFEPKESSELQNDQTTCEGTNLLFMLQMGQNKGCEQEETRLVEQLACLLSVVRQLCKVKCTTDI